MNINRMVVSVTRTHLVSAFLERKMGKCENDTGFFVVINVDNTGKRTISYCLCPSNSSPDAQRVILQHKEK